MSLTDEEIKQIARDGGWDDSYQSTMFARSGIAPTMSMAAVADASVQEAEKWGV